MDPIRDDASQASPHDPSSDLARPIELRPPGSLDNLPPLHPRPSASSPARKKKRTNANATISLTKGMIIPEILDGPSFQGWCERLGEDPQMEQEDANLPSFEELMGRKEN